MEDKKQKLLIVSRSTIYHNQSGGLETQLDNLIQYLKDFYKITVLTTSLPTENDWKIDQKRIKNSVEYIFLKNTIPGEYGYSVYESLLWQIPVKRDFNSLNTNFRKTAGEYFKNNLKGDFNVILSQSSSAQGFNITNEKLVLINHGTSLNEIKNRFNSRSKLFENLLLWFKDAIRFLLLDLPVLLYEHLVNNPRLFKKAHKIVLISDRLEKDFEKHHKKFISKTIVIPNGIDTDRFSPGKKFEKFTVIYAGRIDKEKGIDRFIEVAKQVSLAQFRVYGGGPDASNIKYQISSIKNLKYHGSVSNKKMAKIMSQSHIFLFLTKRKEGMPMSILESMSSGCVVVSTLEDKDLSKEEGYFYVKDQSEAIAVLRKLKKDKFERYSKKARKYALKNFSYSVMGKRYRDLLNNL